MNNDDFRRLALGQSAPRAVEDDLVSDHEQVQEQRPQQEPQQEPQQTQVEAVQSWPELVAYDGRMVAIAIRNDRPDVRVITVLEEDLNAELELELAQEVEPGAAAPLTADESQRMELVVLLVVRACADIRITSVIRVPRVVRRWRAIATGAAPLPPLPPPPPLPAASDLGPPLVERQ